ncbi:MAG: hypothetical protein Q9187_002651 [Circinaria calcarea]
MSDPLTIAGGTVGVISLSIQVCQGLVSYYDSWKSYEETLSHNDIRLDQLEMSLEILKSSLSRLDPANVVAAQHVNDIMVSCKDGTDNLKKILDKCRLVQHPKGLREQLKDFGRKALFPFKKDTLKSLKTTVTELQGNIDSAMQVLELDVLGSHGQALKSVASTSSRTETGIQEVHTKLQYIENKLQSSNQTIPVIQQQTSKIAANTCRIGDSLEDMAQNLSSFQDNIMSAETAVAVQMKQYRQQMQGLVNSLHTTSLAEFEKLVRIRTWLKA